jgi:hypothetical protein
MKLGSWRDGFVRPTRQYVAGILGGFGLGFMTGSWVSGGWNPLLVIPGCTLIAIGGFLARADQQAQQEGEKGETRTG